MTLRLEQMLKSRGSLERVYVRLISISEAAKVTRTGELSMLMIMK